MIISDFDIKFCWENISRLIDCTKESPIYEEVYEEFNDLKQKAYQLIKPYGLLEFARIPQGLATEKVPAGTRVLYTITTVGSMISEWSTSLFAQGNYLAGMLVDAMADDYLFQVDHSLKDIIISLCKDRDLGVKKRLEAPNGISMEVQREALVVTHGEEELGISINQSYMYDPVKTTCQVYLLELGSKEYKINHNCRSCPAVTCKMRSVEQIRITVKSQDKIFSINSMDQESILDSLRREGHFISAVCGGRGTCGKCRIKLVEGYLPPSRLDREYFTAEELEKGMRLACTSFPDEDIAIEVGRDPEEQFFIVSEYDFADNNKSADKRGGEEYHRGVAVDIGTTTIAMQLLDLQNGKVIKTYTAINRQRAYGADVISRMEASNQGKKQELKESILKDLWEGLKELAESFDKMVIAGNTTMIHLLMGYSCETLGVYPFTPFYVGSIHTDFEGLFSDNGKFLLSDMPGNILPGTPVVILPGISTYVGGDITAGISACQMNQSQKVCVLIDLGTNGEMAVGNKDRILVTSTAAGPAFEGGNISCGTGCIPGAICRVKIKGKDVDIETIGKLPPSGICGTGVVETVYELLKEGLVDETGLLEEEYFEEGFVLAQNESVGKISFTQKDIRELQLAKAAVRAGLETLLLRYGVTQEEIDCVYLAGGFGFQMDLKKAAGIGLLPDGLCDKIKTVGNSSLRGAVCCLLEEEALAGIEKMIAAAKEINLSNDLVFNELYMEYMFFGESMKECRRN